MSISVPLCGLLFIFVFTGFSHFCKPYAEVTGEKPGTKHGFRSSYTSRIKRSPEGGNSTGNSTASGGVKKKPRTKGWAYEANLSRCEGPRPYKGRWKLDIKTIGKKKKCNRGINYREERNKSVEYLKKKIEEHNKG